MNIELFSATPVSLVTKEGLQLIKITTESDLSGHIILRITNEIENKKIAEKEIAISSGEYHTELYLPSVQKDSTVKWELYSLSGDLLFSTTSLWKKPREWKLYIMLSSHTDIGLHNSHYFQRYNTEKLLDKAAELCDADPFYHYTLEGTWCWNNYNADRSNKEIENIRENYIKKGKIGICAGIAGNHTHAYGFEELARSINGKEMLQKEHGIHTDTLTMIDNNGLSWGLVTPYAEAGIKNILFSQNQWNPLPSTVWSSIKEKPQNNPENSGGGSRIDITVNSALPRVFYWLDKTKSHKILVFCGGKYSEGSELFGFSPYNKEFDYWSMKKCTSDAITRMEKRFPYDMWLCPCYYDDQEPSLYIAEGLKQWKEKWAWPRFEIIGNIDNFFRKFREKFDSVIPELSGEITGGWYQHPLSAPQLLADKLDADRRLANAETFASIAAHHTEYEYPVKNFENAWKYLLYNDEHSYGTSGYQGIRVYETWMQHRDWIEKAAETAAKETDLALDALTEKITATENAVIVFNPTARKRTERIEIDGDTAVACEIPPCGYKVINKTERITEETISLSEPPIIENVHYRIAFSSDGSMSSIYDKQLKKEIIKKNEYGANCFIFTEDNHNSFVTPEKAEFTLVKSKDVIKVIARVDEPHSGATITQTVTLDSLHHKIDIDNQLSHISAMINNNRYYRYIYYSFPFDVPNAKRICQLNGCEAEYAKDLTGHTTDTYMNAHEWALAENGDFGAALIQRDSLLIEFDHIHPDKTDYGNPGNGSAIYSYVSNDWLQMHEVGGSHVNLHLRYSITSWAGRSEASGIREMAECFVNPVILRKKEKCCGELDGDSYSFLTVPNEQRFICLKRANDGEGAILRLYGERKYSSASLNANNRFEFCDINENAISAPTADFGLSSLRFKDFDIKCRKEAAVIQNDEKPAPIGSYFTDLITRPRVARGENDGMLYLLWGQNIEKNLSHYELFRGKTKDFIPSDETLIAKVEPEEYRVGRYVDEGLETHTEYFYRVRAVNAKGTPGGNERCVFWFYKRIY